MFGYLLRYNQHHLRDSRIFLGSAEWNLRREEKVSGVQSIFDILRYNFKPEEPIKFFINKPCHCMLNEIQILQGSIMQVS